jgi:hypothetical protein
MLTADEHSPVFLLGGFEFWRSGPSGAGARGAADQGTDAHEES